MSEPLTLHPDRLFPPDPTTRDIARRLYAEVADLPIVSPHGHVPPQWIADDVPFRDPTSLLITPDHYVTRLLHASGVSLRDLGVGRDPLDEKDARAAFRILCEHWDVYAGTPMRFWMESQFVDIFGVTQRPSAENADAVYDTIAEWIAKPTSRPRALLDAFDIEFIATTDDPCDDLHFHEQLANDASFTRRVAPTFRPDPYLEPFAGGWNERVDRLGEVSGEDVGSYDGFIRALENRRAYFKAHGAVSTDHSHADLGTQPLEPAEAARIYAEARGDRASEADCTALRRHLMFEMIRMATEDGLTLTLHPAVFRNHHTASFERYGADVGGDIPMSLEVTRALQPALARFGTAENLNLVVFTIDETVYSRELAPLAGFYPSVYVGVPWWFIDAPDAIMRFKKAVTETAGFSRLSGFIDDTRAFCSIPARHDMSRRLDCAHLAELVAQHRLPEDEAAAIARGLVADSPRKVFKL